MAGKGPQYIGGSSDKRYQDEARRRLRGQLLKNWVIRLVILAAVIFAAKTWGPTVLAAIAQSGKDTVSSVERGTGGIKAGVDERSGTNFKDE